jgi:hypothetical protein
MKYRFMAEQRGAHSVGKMAKVLEVSRSGYHAWVGRPSSRRQGAEAELTEQIREIQKEAKRLPVPDNVLGRNFDRVAEINRKLMGWARYFCLGAVSNTYRAVDQHTRQRLFGGLTKSYLWTKFYS